ncbi:MAG TPA: MFS transporter [Jatrophihabitantaceae bacterium]
MTTTAPVRARQRARAAVAITFATNGFLFGSWVPRIPEVKHDLHLSSAALGLALLAPAVGSVLSMNLYGRASARFGSARLTRFSLVLFCAFAWLPGLAHNLPTLWLTLFVWGTAIGGLDVVMNAQGVTVEHAYERPVLSGFHAAWSLGSLTGALIGGLGAGADIPISAQQGTLAGVVLVGVLLAGRAYLPDPPHHAETAPTTGKRRALPELRLVLLGVAGLFALLSEGAVADWSGVLLRDNLHAHPGQVGLAYAAFSTTMTGGRLAGDRVVHALGRARSIALLTAIGAAGLAAGLATGSLIGTVIGFALLGIGLSVMVPVVFSTAADGAAPGPAIAMVSTLGYTGFLVGPTAIGVIAEGTSVPFALWLLPIFTTAGGVLGIAAVRMTAARNAAASTAESQIATPPGEASH